MIDQMIVKNCGDSLSMQRQSENKLLFIGSSNWYRVSIIPREEFPSQTAGAAFDLEMVHVSCSWSSALGSF